MSAGGEVLRGATKALREQMLPMPARSIRLGPQIRGRDLLALSPQTGCYRLLGGAGPDDVLLHGDFEMAGLQPGLAMHTAAVTDQRSLHSESEVREGLKIVLVLDGLTEMRYGHRAMALGPAGGESNATVLSVTARDGFSRCWRQGRAERKLVITLSPDWVATHFSADEGCFAERVRAFAGEHLAAQAWQPSARAQLLAREVIDTPALPPGLRRAWQTARCLDIAIEALGVVGNATAGSACCGRRELLAHRLCELLQSPQAASLSLAEMARQVGSNPVSLQQIARETLGMTVFEYLREQGLLRAREALAQGQAVTAAAELAGYASPANFATAFKRRFGLTPRQVRRA